jgi:hypothetical protein
MRDDPDPTPRSARRRSRLLGVAIAALLAVALHPAPLTAKPPSEALTAREIIAKVNEGDVGRSLSQRMTLRIQDRRDRPRERGLLSYRTYTESESRLAFYVTSPPDMRNMAYLVYDHLDASKDDDQWIYTPRRAEPRRIAATNLRESFLGSEFTLEDVKRFFRIEIDAYEWELVGSREVEGRTVHEVLQRPGTDALAKALGVSRMRNFVDGEHWVRRQVDLYDLEGKPLRTIRLTVAAEGDGAARVVKAVAKNVQSGFESEFTFHEIRPGRPADDDVFTQRGLRREEVGRLEREFAH